MKYLATPFLLMIASIPSAFSSDQFVDEIRCTEDATVRRLRATLDVAIQSNPTAWVKRAAVIDNGPTFPQEIASFQIPLDQPDVGTPSFFSDLRVARYWAPGFELLMEVADSNGNKVLGPASALVTLPGRDPLTLQLVCQRLN